MPKSSNNPSNNNPLDSPTTRDGMREKGAELTEILFPDGIFSLSPENIPRFPG